MPPKTEPSYLPTLFYTVRSHIALENYDAALALLPSDSTDTQVRALRSLASYFETEDDADKYLEELRDLCIEIEEGYEGEEGDGMGSGLIKVAAATAFINEEELEEALTTLGAGLTCRDIERLGKILHASLLAHRSVHSVALIVQVYLSINRPDLAKKEYDAAKKWADDSLLIQLIEASIGLAVVSLY